VINISVSVVVKIIQSNLQLITTQQDHCMTSPLVDCNTGTALLLEFGGEMQGPQA